MVEEVKKHWFIVNSEKRAFCAIFRRFEVPRDGFYINRIRKIAFISKRLAEKFCYMVKVIEKYFIYNPHIVVFLLIDF